MQKVASWAEDRPEFILVVWVIIGILIGSLIVRSGLNNPEYLRGCAAEVHGSSSLEPALLQID